MRIALLVPAGLICIALVIVIGGSVVQWLWNWLLPPLFGFPQVTFWQAFGILALCRILFGRFGSGRGSESRTGFGRIGDKVAERVADRVAEKFEGMTPEERERFRRRLRERCGFDPAPPGPTTASGGSSGR